MQTDDKKAPYDVNSMTLKEPDDKNTLERQSMDVIRQIRKSDTTPYIRPSQCEPHNRTMECDAKVQHALWILEALESMRNKKLICDFEIKVDGQVFSVHRPVLMACSMYFKAMFSSHMRESRRGYVEMKPLSVDGVDACIQYMYTGEIAITSDNVASVIEASHFMQIDALTDICRHFLRQHLDADNCLMTLKIFKIYGNESDVNAAEKCIVDELETVIASELFPEISAQDLTDYLKASRTNSVVHWKAITSWLTEDDDEKVKFFTAALHSILKMKGIPTDLLISAVWSHPQVEKNDDCKVAVLSTLAKQAKNHDMDMSVENAFILQCILRDRPRSNFEVLRRNVTKVLAKKFVQILEMQQFYDMNVENLCDLLEYHHLRCADETYKWEAILKWVKCEERRVEYLHILMHCIDFDEIPITYLHQNMRSESVVTRSPECLQILYDALYAKSAPRESAIITMDSQSGSLHRLDLTGRNKHIELPVAVAVSGAKVISAGRKLHILCDNVLYRFSGKAKWKRLASLSGKPSIFNQVVAVKGDIYIFDTTNMACFESAAGKWHEKFPGCGYGNGFCAAGTEDAIYVCGGGYGCNKATRFDLKSSKWTDVAPMKEKRALAAACYFRDKLYVMGGYEILIESTKWRHKNSVEMYDLPSRAWTVIANMKKMRCNFTAAVCDDVLYAVGGAAEGNESLKDSVESFDSETSQWKIVAELPRPEGEITSCVCDAPSSSVKLDDQYI